ncbi:efflux RND transporter permease subunit, partial [Brevibacterium sp. SIMBA_078]|uniref:efflux RND transporter permease subunit n=1 Tax=Brevibacterium sp. SIMBA_078 TaxID=3085816 RepID=UPI00397E34AE
RELLDWQMRPLLRTVSGVADVNSLGGYVKTFAIAPDNLLMQHHQVSFLQLREAIEQTNQNGGIGRLEKGNDTLILRTEGKYSDLEAIKNTVIKSTQNKVIRLSDVAHVDVGSLTRYGAVT